MTPESFSGVKERPQTFGRQVAFHSGHLKLRHVTYWIAFAMAAVVLGFSPFRYLFLVVPFLVLVAILGDGTARLRDEAKPFLALVLMGLVLAPMNTREGAKDLFLTFAGVSVALLVDYPRMSLWRILATVLFAFVFFFGLFGNWRQGISFSVADSKSSFEGNFSYVFALMVPFAIRAKRKWLALLAIALTVLTLKRIGVLAAFAALMVSLMGEAWIRRILRPSVMIPANFLLLAMMILYSSGTFDQIIFDVTGQSANQFGQGRRTLWAAPSHMILDEPWKFIFGQGSGSVYALTRVSHEMAQKTLLHSDMLRVFFEFGALFYIAFIWLMYSSKDYLVRLGFLFMNILYLTDNTLSYYYFIFYFVVILQATREDIADSHRGV